jgi:hypothetical protein
MVATHSTTEKCKKKKTPLTSKLQPLERSFAHHISLESQTQFVKYFSSIFEFIKTDA